MRGFEFCPPLSRLEIWSAGCRLPSFDLLSCWDICLLDRFSLLIGSNWIFFVFCFFFCLDFLQPFVTEMFSFMEQMNMSVSISSWNSYFVGTLPGALFRVSALMRFSPVICVISLVNLIRHIRKCLILDVSPSRCLIFSSCSRGLWFVSLKNFDSPFKKSADFLQHCMTDNASYSIFAYLCSVSVCL